MAEQNLPLSDGFTSALESFTKSEMAQQKEAEGKRTKAAEAQILSYEGQYSKPAPEFQPSQESASGFAALGALLASAGAILGSGGKTSGLMAMNAVSGMMNGYNSGRKDLYEQQRQQFEEHMKTWEKNRTLVKEAFDRAMKIAPTNLTMAQQSLNRDLIALGMQPLAEMNRRSGPVPTAAAFNRADSKMDDMLSKLKMQLGTQGGKLSQEDMAYVMGLPPKQRVAYLEALSAGQKAKAEAEQARLKIRSEESLIAEREATAKAKAAEPSYGSELGPVGKTAYNELTPDKQKSFDEFYKGVKPQPDDKKEIRTNFESRNETEELAKYVAQNQDAVNYLAKTFQTRAEYFKSIYEAFTKAQTPEQVAAATRQADAAEQQLVNDMTRDSQSSDPKIKDVASRATVLAKLLQRASLADAAAIGRPTVFLERMTGKWYDQGVRPDTLMQILYSRAKDADTRLENYQLGSASTKPEIQFNKYPLLSRGPDALLTRYGQPPSFPNEAAAYQILKQRGYKTGDIVRGYVGGTLVDIEVE